MKKTKVVSKAAFARMLGITPPAVTSAIKSGRISVRSDGMIDAESAKRQWRQNTDPARSPVKFSESLEPQSAPLASAEGGGATAVTPEALGVIGRLLAEQGVASSGPLTITNARVAEVVSRTLAREFQTAILRREYVPLQAVQKHIERIFMGVKQSFQSMPSRYAAMVANELGSEVHATEWAMRRAVNAVLLDLSTPPTVAESVGGEPAVTGVVEDVSDE